MSRAKAKVKFSLAMSWVLLCLGNSSLAAVSSMTEADAVSLIRSAQIVKADYPLRAIISAKEVIVQTKRASNSSDKDCKIDAVFIAKTLLDAYPKAVGVVKVLFAHESDDKYSEVTVNADQVADYGSKKITQQKLLDSIQLKSVDPLEQAPASNPSISLEPGPYRERRLMLLDSIQSLKQQGSGVKPFEQLFSESEALIRAGNGAKADEVLTELASTVKAQELQREHLRNFHSVVVKSDNSNNSAPLAKPNDNSGKPLVPPGQSPGHDAPGVTRPPEHGNREGSGTPNEHGANASTDIHPIHNPHEFDQRMRQIDERARQQPESRIQIIRSSRDRIRDLLNNNEYYSAESEIRRLEQDLGCSNNYWNVMP
jgi:hypothetical protein